VTSTSTTPWDDPEESDYQCWVRYTNLTIGAATIVATPALQQAVITLASVDLPETPIAVANAQAQTSIAAAAHRPSLLEQPPAAWFESPQFHVGDPRLIRQRGGSLACPLTVTDDGRVFGHVSYWGAEHTGARDPRTGKPITTPRSPHYGYFMTGVRQVDSGLEVPVGQLTMGCGHAAPSLTGPRATAHYRPAAAHYDGGYGAVQVADVCAGEDDFGIWVAGAIRPEVPEDDVRKFKALALSGDWRTYGGALHMVAALAVPVPGFPISRTDVLVAAAEIVDSYAARCGIDATTGRVLSVVAAGRVQPRPVGDRVAELELVVGVLMAERRERLAAEALAELDSVL
jgi:hypothetical protein